MEASTPVWRYKGHCNTGGCGDHIVVLGRFWSCEAYIWDVCMEKMWWPANPQRVSPFWSSAWTPAILFCGRTLQSSEGLKAHHTWHRSYHLNFFSEEELPQVHISIWTEREEGLEICALLCISTISIRIKKCVKGNSHGLSVVMNKSRDREKRWRARSNLAQGEN